MLIISYLFFVTLQVFFILQNKIFSFYKINNSLHQRPNTKLALVTDEEHFLIEKNIIEKNIIEKNKIEKTIIENNFN